MTALADQKLAFKEVYITQCLNKDYWYAPLVNRNVPVWGEDANHYFGGMPPAPSLINKTDAVPVMDPHEHSGGHEYQTPTEPNDHRTMDQETKTIDAEENELDPDLLKLIPMPDVSSMDATTMAEELQLEACRFRRLRIAKALRYEMALEFLDLKRIGEGIIRATVRSEQLKEKLKTEPLQKDRDNLEQEIGELDDLVKEYEATASATKSFICSLEGAIAFTVEGSPDPEPT